jgi:hypothetical protein
MATYSQATIDAMNKRGKALLDPNKAKPPKPTPAKPTSTYVVPAASANITSQLNGLPYSYTPPNPAGSQTSYSSGSSGSSTSGGGKSRASDTTRIETSYTVGPSTTSPSWIGDGTSQTGNDSATTDTTPNDYYADLLANQEEAARIRTQGARDANMANVGKVNAYSDRALQNAYISKELNRVNMPQQLSALGYSGGATETSMTGAMTDYENRRGTIEQDRADALNDIYENDAQILATGNAELADLGTQYYQNLIEKQTRDEANALSQSRWQTEFNADQASEAYQNKLDLAKIKASYGDYSGLQALGISVNALNNDNGSTPATKAYTARAKTATASASSPTSSGNYNTVLNNVKRALGGSNAGSQASWNAAINYIQNELNKGTLTEYEAQQMLGQLGLN